MTTIEKETYNEIIGCKFRNFIQFVSIMHGELYNFAHWNDFQASRSHTERVLGWALPKADENARKIS